MASETRFCTNPRCTATWIVEIDFNDGGVQRSNQRNPEVCEHCENEGYSIKNINWHRWHLIKNGELINVCTRSAVNEKPEIFVPHDKLYMCANKDCANSWSVHIFEPSPFMICGGDAKVCSTAGFEIGSSIGDGP